MNTPDSRLGRPDTLLAAWARKSGDPALAEAVETAQRAYDALSLERMSLANRLAELSAQTERELARSLTIARVAETVNSSLDIDVVLNRVLDIAVDVTKAERGFIMIADEATGELELAATYNLERADLDSHDLQPSETTVERVFKTGEPVFTTDAQRDPRLRAQLSVRALKLRSIMCVPLAIKERRVGVIYLDSRTTPGRFTREDPELLTSLAHQAALAIENANLFQEQRTQLRDIVRLKDIQTKVLRSIASGVVTVDASGLIATFNDAAAATFGIDAAAMIGRPLLAIDAFIPRASEIIASEGVTKPTQIDAFHPTRGKLRVEMRVTPLDIGENDEPESHGLAIAFHDLTERLTFEKQRRAEAEQRQAIGDAFSRYLAPHVVDSLMSSPGDMELGGRRCAATILFADIRDFTKMAARMDAERVVEMLNEYFEAAVGVIFKHDGLLDKFYGDGLMAVFGAPRERKDDAARALVAATELHALVRELEPKLHEPLRISVGLASGDVVAGHIGSTRRMDYTVIGDAVNLASRLQSAAPASATYCDETTYLRSGLQLPAERLQAKIKGRDDLVTVYRLT
jgi:adenylate cyclase